MDCACVLCDTYRQVLCCLGSCVTSTDPRSFLDAGTLFCRPTVSVMFSVNPCCPGTGVDSMQMFEMIGSRRDVLIGAVVFQVLCDLSWQARPFWAL